MNKFNEDDIGKRVLLIIDLHKLDDKYLEDNSENNEIPYEAIKDYKFIQYIRNISKPGQKIIDTSKSAQKINSYLLVKRMGITEVRTICDIIEVAEDYLKVEVVKDRRAPWHQSKSRYTK